MCHCVIPFLIYWFDVLLNQLLQFITLLWVWHGFSSVLQGKIRNYSCVLSLALTLTFRYLKIVYIIKFYPLIHDLEHSGVDIDLRYHAGYFDIALFA